MARMRKTVLACEHIVASRATAVLSMRGRIWWPWCCESNSVKKNELQRLPQIPMRRAGRTLQDYTECSMIRGATKRMLQNRPPLTTSK
jgi:hypothetical protein